MFMYAKYIVDSFSMHHNRTIEVAPCMIAYTCFMPIYGKEEQICFAFMIDLIERINKRSDRLRNTFNNLL